MSAKTVPAPAQRRHGAEDPSAEHPDVDRPEARDDRGRTALAAAAYANELDVARMLVRAGSDVNAKDATGQGPYLIATSEVGDDPALLELLVGGGAEVNDKDRYNGTGLIRAAERGHARIVRRLLRTGIAVSRGSSAPRALGVRARKNLRIAVANLDTMHVSLTQEMPVAAPLAYRAGPVTRAAAQGERGTRDDSQAWLAALRGPVAVREAALADLHALLLRGARYELSRRRLTLSHVPHGELDDLAMQAADDALVAILAKLDSFRGASRFTTWAYKFVLLEAGVRARRRAWHDREVALEDNDWPAARDLGPSAQQVVEGSELLQAIGDAARTELTSHQREVFCALALNGVPIDVLAERRGTTRGALYKTLHDARRKLRAAVAGAGYAVETTTALGGGRDH
jgi:RNA polymerase sigma-70 factor (ECF subfamily)